ncbi:MAG TPA: GNAT family N-acetyltransferase [Fulvivirga sp.]|nr:GNAT family N-acetyltransferase [Fulvivirga sp.]
MIRKTSRLSITRITIADAPFILKLVNSPTFKQFIGDRNLKTEEDAANYIQSWALGNYAKHGFGPYIVRAIDGNCPVGTCGLFKREKLAYPDLGYAFLPEFTGLGYASESAQAVIEYAFNDLKMPILYAITNHDNANSIKLLSKLGFNQIPLKYDANTKVFELKASSID